MPTGQALSGRVRTAIAGLSDAEPGKWLRRNLPDPPVTRPALRCGSSPDGCYEDQKDDGL